MEKKYGAIGACVGGGGYKQRASVSKHSRQIRLTLRASPYSSVTSDAHDGNYIIVKTSISIYLPSMYVTQKSVNFTYTTQKYIDN